jgi:5-carboxymethyl-2-hydroxymuconate isomerase
MPHLVILYTPNIEGRVNLPQLCRDLADTMLAQRDEQDKAVFPLGGTRVLAYPAAHFAVADGKPPTGQDFAFVYLNLRMGAGRSAAVKQRIGDDLKAVLHRHFDPCIQRDLLGVTLQIDDHAPAYDAKISSLHPYFNPPQA